MITNDGKSIIGKYLINQAPSYAGYIAVGSGADPKHYQSIVPTSWSISGSTATVTVSGGHNFAVGESLIINFNDSRIDGTVTVASANATAFTFPANITLPSISSVDDANPSTGFALYTTSAAHNLKVGDLITTTGFTDTDFNNTDVAIYTVPSPTTFTIIETGTGTTSTGTLSVVKPALLDANAIVIRNYVNKTTLDYEMFRVPIVSRAFSVEDGINKVVLTAELPTQDSYLMTEAAVFSSGTNPIASSSDSRSLYSFSENEGWEYHTDTAIKVTTATGIGNVAGAVNTIGTTTFNGSSTSIGNLTAFALESTEAMFDADPHVYTNSKPRVLSNFIVLRGDLSAIDTSSTTWTASSQPHIHIQNQRFGFGVNASTDQLKLAFSVINRNPVIGANAAVDPDNIYVMIEFSTAESEVESDNQYARMQVQLSSTDFADVDETRYFVSTKTLGELATSAGFSWDAVRIAKIYVEADPPSTLDNTVTYKRTTGTDNVTARLELGTSPHKFAIGDFVTITNVDSTFNGTHVVTNIKTSGENYIEYTIPTGPAVANTAVSPAGVAAFSPANYYVLLDGLRFENISDMELNPLYGMTAYTTINDTDTLASNSAVVLVPVTKDVNTSGLLEFKINLELNSEG